jgi:hypothetical protein
MKMPDIKSTVIAGAIGALALFILVKLFDSNNTNPNTYATLGFATGVLVQVGVRLTGVS